MVQVNDLISIQFEPMKIGAPTIGGIVGSGTNAVVRELGIERNETYRSIKIQRVSSGERGRIRRLRSVEFKTLP